MALILLFFVACLTFNALAVPAPNVFPLRQRQLPASSSGVPGVDASFDYVVVGGGTAGLTIAARLAENSSNTVAVIEAGGFYEVDAGNAAVIPGNAVLYTGANPNDTEKIDWGLVTTPQAVCGNEDDELRFRLIVRREGS